MEALLFLLILGLLYEVIKPKPKVEKSPVDKVKDSIREKEDGKINADEFFQRTREVIVLDQDN